MIEKMASKNVKLESTVEPAILYLKVCLIRMFLCIPLDLSLWSQFACYVEALNRGSHILCILD